MINLSLGANIVLNQGVINIKINSGLPVDASAFRLFANDKVKDDLDMIFYGQPKNQDASIIWQQTHNNNHEFRVDLTKLSAEVQKIAFTITCDQYSPISKLKNLSIQLDCNNEVVAVGEVDINNRQEKALIMGEIYRRNSEWKFRFIAQGFNGGLKPLAEHYGVNVIDDPTPQTTTATIDNTTTTSSVNLNKISLSKDRTSVSLSKKNDYGKIGINLNWNKQGQATKKGFLSELFNRSPNIDLDLAAFVRLKDQSIHVIQALGNCFGSFQSPCYVELMGDDRTGANQDGEWIYINGSHWNNIDEVLIYTFIYEGLPNWSQADGVVRIHVPDQPIIETFLTDGHNSNILCAIARLKNDNGAINVERINRYFCSQRELDYAYGWGFRWSAGRK